jgi:hypothetical protein
MEDERELSPEQVSGSESEGMESGEPSDDTEANLVNHLYELLTNASGVNVTEAIIGVSEALDKTNKILYKILGILSQGRPVAPAPAPAPAK